jgi:hypothetical protein
MGKINLARVFLGGLLAGLILNIFEYVLNGVVFASQWALFEKLTGRQMRPGAIPFFIVSSFLMGIGVVWLYAVARPRLGGHHSGHADGSPHSQSRRLRSANSSIRAVPRPSSQPRR